MTCANSELKNDLVHALKKLKKSDVVQCRVVTTRPQECLEYQKSRGQHLFGDPEKTENIYEKVLPELSLEGKINIKG